MKDYSEYDLSVEEHFDICGNNGLGDTRHPAKIPYMNFFFRSPKEILYFMALDKRRKIYQEEFIIFPCATASLPGAKRKEPDFLIIKDGFWLRVEIDGESHNGELAFERIESEAWALNNLINTKRYRSYHDSDETWADDCAKDTIEYIDKINSLGLRYLS